MSRRRTGQNMFATKEDTNFTEALKLYEAKQYKKALKLVDTNLKKKNHSESVALKGLLLYNIHNSNGKNEDPEHREAQLYFKKALKDNETNPIINHIVAIFYRALPDYAEAAKYYKLAVDYGSENKNILKDLAVTEAQLRRYKALANSRSEVLNAFPGYRAHWTGLAVAHHLNQNYELAEKTLSRFEDLAEGKLSEPEFFEHSECLLYRNKIIYESGDIKRALASLDDIYANVLDKLSVEEARGIYQTLLGDKKAASLTYRKLLKRNPDKTEYYFLLESALEIRSTDIKRRLKLYNKLEQFYPKSDPPKIIPLVFLDAESSEFKEKLNSYLVTKLSKGVPSVFNALSFLYKLPAKVKIMEQLAFEFLNKVNSEKSDPTISVWTLYFISQHYLKLGNLSKAEEFIDKAIGHSPTLVELLLFKAKITKHKGDFETAGEIVNGARLLDLQDRFINCKTVKYYLRANNVEKAIQVASLFTKNDNAINGLKDLHLMQVHWYLIEEAEAYFRLFKDSHSKLITRLSALESSDVTPETIKDVKENIDLVNKYKGLSVKRFMAVVSNYKDFENDQLDFHSYCLRKGTPRAYIDMLNWADNLYNQPLFLRAVKGLSEIYLEINHELMTKDTSLIEKYTSLALDKKNNRGKNKNKFNKKKEDEAAKVTAYDNDSDIYGENFIFTSKPMDDLYEHFALIKNKTSVFYLKLAFFIFLYQSKFILAFQLLKSSKELISQSSFLPYALVKLTIAANANKDPKLAAITQVLLKSVSAIFPDFKIDNLQESFANFFKNIEINHDLENIYLRSKTLKIVDTEKFGLEFEALGQRIVSIASRDLDKSLSRNDEVIARDYVASNGSEDYYWI